jgi:hypothetical protein
MVFLYSARRVCHEKTNGNVLCAARIERREARGATAAALQYPRYCL